MHAVLGRAHMDDSHIRTILTRSFTDVSVEYFEHAMDVWICAAAAAAGME